MEANLRICDLRQKEEINQCNCKRLGFVSDVELDICDGKIVAIIVPGTGKFCGFFGRDTEYVIPFCKICQIGEEIILVNVKEDEVRKPCHA